MTTNSDRYVVIPLEVKVRDFSSRLLLSLQLCREGFNIIIGSQDIIHSQIQNLPKSIYFDKSLSKNKLKFFKKIKNLGFRIVSQDEEGLCSLFNYERYITQRVCNETLELAECVFTWGKSEAKLIKDKYPKNADKIIVTGNPRIDLLQDPLIKSYEKLSFRYKENVGPYFLFPSSFTVNHAMGRENINDHLVKMGRVQNKNDLEKYHIKQKFFEKTYKEYADLVRLVAIKFKDTKIIVRPHPSEDHAEWNKLAKGYSNIKIINDGDIASWIIGAELVVHSSCTTGMESFIIGKPVISFLPYTDHEYVKQISNKVSKVCSSKSEVIQNIKFFQTNQYFENYNRSELTSYLSKHINNINNTFSYELISNHLKKIQQLKDKRKLPLLKFHITKLKRILRSFKSILLNPKGYNYSIQKFPGLKKSELLDKINNLVKFSNQQNNFIVKKIDKDLFLIRYDNS